MAPNIVELAIAFKLREIRRLLVDNGYDDSYLSMVISKDPGCDAPYIQFNNEYWDRHMSQPLNYRRYL